MKKITFFFLSLLFFTGASALPAASSYLIYNPSAEVSDYGSYDFSMRFYREGSILTRANFAVISGINLGFSLDFEKVIGTDSVKGHSPSLNLKLKLTKEKGLLPQAALGYDSQGYGKYNKELKEYAIREKGFYAALSWQKINPSIHCGINVVDLEDFEGSENVYAFGGVGAKLGEKVTLLMEGSNILHGSDSVIYNTGMNWRLLEDISIQFNFENLGSGGDRMERTFMVNYQGAF
ncbi:MAG TPA: hypothetical protein VJC03_09130 [bacterium]|nr:hypothetical protein [bacterium]